MRRDPRALLWDIKEACDAITRFTANQDASSFVASELVHTAVERKFEIIGEALSQLAKLDPPRVERIPDFRRAISFRNLLIHGYAAIDSHRVWRTVEEVVPELRLAVTALLREAGAP